MIETKNFKIELFGNDGDSGKATNSEDEDFYFVMEDGVISFATYNSSGNKSNIYLSEAAYNEIYNAIKEAY